MNLQSKFGYCVITQTLNTALCKQDGIIDRQTNRQTDDPITRCPRRTFQAQDIIWSPDLFMTGHCIAEILLNVA